MRSQKCSVFCHFYLFLFSISFFCSSVWADTSEPALRFAVYDTLPFGYFDENGKPKGTVVEIAELIAEEAGIAIDIYLVPVSRVVRDVSSGDADLAILLDRAGSVDSIEKIGLVETTRIVLSRLKKDTAFNESDLFQDETSIGLVRGAYYGEELEFFLSNINARQIESTNIQYGINMLLRNRIDYLLSLEISLAYALKTHASAQQLEAVKFFRTYDSALYMSSRTRNKEDIKQRLKEALLSLVEKNALKPIHRDLKIQENQPYPALGTVQ